MSGEITQLLSAIRTGDRQSFDRLFGLVYAELKSDAHWQLRDGQGPRTLSTTALVHETYLKLTAAESPDWADRGHFFAVAARAMRQIVVDRARRRIALKRGGDAVKLDLDDLQVAAEEQADQLIALEEAMRQLEQTNERLSRVVELRFYAGLSVEDTAKALDVSERTIKRDWRLARAYLTKELDTSSEE